MGHPTKHFGTANKTLKNLAALRFLAMGGQLQIWLFFICGLAQAGGDNPQPPDIWIKKL
jgi:hypothetical protein